MIHRHPQRRIYHHSRVMRGMNRRGSVDGILQDGRERIRHGHGAVL
jgi:hypothetical protein